MTAAVFRKTLHGLSPVDEDAQKILHGIKPGQLVTVEVKRPRNLQHHRLWWKLCSVVAENLPGDYPAETVCELIKLRIGHVDIIKTRGGITEIPKSISFAKMDQTQFREFFDRAVAFICSDLLPGVNRDELTQHVNELLGAGQAA